MLTASQAESVFDKCVKEGRYRELVYIWHVGRDTEVGRKIAAGTHWTVRDDIPDVDYHGPAATDQP